MQVISVGNAQPKRRANSAGIVPEHLGSWITSYMGRPRGSSGKDAANESRPGREEVYPMAFVVEQDPESALNAHFHTVDQFQVFTEGDGMLAADPVKATTVQFVSPFTPYGPIKAGAHGVSYFTLRNAFDPGARFMPGAKHELPPRPRSYRQVLSPSVPPLADAERAEAGATAVVELIAPGEDGLGAWLYRIPPGGSATGPDPATGRGQHWIVLGGALQRDGELLERMSCGFLHREEPAFFLQAGPRGLEILALQYPRRPDFEPRN